MKRYLHLCIATLLIINTPANAAAPVAPSNVLLEEAKSRGGQVEYLGHAYGLDGWLIVNPKGGAQYAYTNKEGATLIGMLFAPDGTMKTQGQLTEYLARKDGNQGHIPGAEQSHASKAEQIYATVATGTHWVQVGPDNVPYLYAFINAYCDHCQTFLKQVMPKVKEGKLALRLIPYGEQEANQMGAAILLSVDNPLAALEELLDGKKEALGKARAELVKEGATAKVIVNSELAKAIVRGGLPFILYRKLSDGQLSAIAGVPKNMMTMLADLTPVEKEIAPPPQATPAAAPTAAPVKDNTLTQDEMKEKTTP